MISTPRRLIDVGGAVEQPEQALNAAKHLQAYLSQFLIAHDTVADTLCPCLGKVRDLMEVFCNARGQCLRHVVGISLCQLLPSRITDQGMHCVQNAAVLGQLQDLAELLNVDCMTWVCR